MEQKDAVFSSCGRYRYSLSRVWDGQLPKAMFVGLNPSTADECTDDPTIRRCRSFVKIWGAYGGLLMGNLFAYCSTNPRNLVRVDDPVGPYCDVWLASMFGETDLVVLCWGGVGASFPERLKEFFSVLRQDRFSDLRVCCFGETKTGQPKHPLYLPKDTHLLEFVL